MKISTKGRYALRMMLDIAVHQGEGYVALKEIAARQNISKKYLEQIALQLTQSGLLHAVGSLAPVACLDQTANACERRLECPTLPIWQGLERMIHDYLHGITLQDILDQSAARRCE